MQRPSRSSLTAPQRRILKEINFNFKPEHDKRQSAKSKLNNEKSKNAKYPTRSGNLEVPVKKDHKGLMGQPDNPGGTRADKLGRPPSNARPNGSSEEPGLADGTRRFRSDPDHLDVDPTGLSNLIEPDTDQYGQTNLGEPLKRGLSDSFIGDDAKSHPSGKSKPTREQGPSETPGKASWNSFGNRGSFGNRYTGPKTGSF